MDETSRQMWLNKVGERHSGSLETARIYIDIADQFCSVVGMALDEIAEEWDNVGSYVEEKKFKRKHQKLVAKYKLWLKDHSYARSTRSSRIATIQSFYNSLPTLKMDFDIPRSIPKFHNRDVTHDEITKILDQTSPRDRAIFCMMAQGGLTPKNTVLLRYRHIKEDFESGRIPCCVHLPTEISKASHSSHFTFVGEESVNYLKQYFEIRGVPNNGDLIFLPTRKDHRSIGIVEKRSLAIIFSEIARSLGLIPEAELEERKGKPKTVRLYSLRKFFRKYAGLAGIEYVNFWMGHKINYGAEHIPRSDEHYFSKNDIEFHRKLYKEKAFPNLKVGSIATSETESVRIRTLEQKLEEARTEIKKLQENNKELKELNELLKEHDVFKILEDIRKIKVEEVT